MYLIAYYHNTTKPEKLMEIVDKTAAIVKRLREENPKITHLVATGSSGQSVAWPVSYKLGIPVCIVRKPGEQSHAGLISGSGDLGEYLIIDDLISTGDSMRRTVKALEERHEELAQIEGLTLSPPKCVGIVLYQDSRATASIESLKTFDVGIGRRVPLYGDNFGHY